MLKTNLSVNKDDLISNIYVYTDNSENKKLIAVFSNVNETNDEEQKKNTLTNPLIHVVMNGESTFSFSILKDSPKWKIVKDPSYKWFCDGRVYTMMYENSVQYDGDMANVTLYEDWVLLGTQYSQVQNVNPVSDSDGSETKVNEPLDIHSVVVLPKSEEDLFVRSNSNIFPTGKNWNKYANNEIKDESKKIYPRGSAGYAMFGILASNSLGWKLGICDVEATDFSTEEDIGTFNLETDMLSILENIQNVQTLWGGVLVWDSLKKIVHLRDETKVGSDFNVWTGFTAYKGKNMMNEPQIQIDNKIITRAYPLGSGNLTIKCDAKDDDAYSYANRYIENEEAQEKYGLLEGYIHNENIHYTGSASNQGQKQLKEWAERELKKLCKPRITYVFSIFDRSFEQGFEHEKFKLYDVIKIQYFNPLTCINEFVEHRIIDIQYSPFDKSSISLITGDKILNNREIFALTYKNATVTNAKTDWKGNVSNNVNGENVFINIENEKEKGQQTIVSALKGQASIIASTEKTIEDVKSNAISAITMSTDTAGKLTLTTQNFSEESNSQSVDIATETVTQAQVETIATDQMASVTISTLVGSKPKAVDSLVSWTEAFINLVSTTGKDEGEDANSGSTIVIKADKVEIDNLVPYRIINKDDPKQFITFNQTETTREFVWYQNNNEKDSDTLNQEYYTPAKSTEIFSVSNSTFNDKDFKPNVTVKLGGVSFARNNISENHIRLLGTLDCTNATIQNLGGVAIYDNKDGKSWIFGTGNKIDGENPNPLGSIIVSYDKDSKKTIGYWDFKNVDVRGLNFTLA